MDYTVNTSADSKYFSRALNLIFSLRHHMPYLRIKIWDLGLTNFQRYVMSTMGVEVNSIPHFMNLWDKCYSWKPYIYKYSKDDIFFYLDAGCTVNKSFMDVFDVIQSDGYFFVNQGQELQEIIPKDYDEVIRINDKNRKFDVFAAGIIGINKKLSLNCSIIDEIFQHTINGYCLGYSSIEIERDVDNLNIIRDCRRFRHDQSVVNGIFRKHLDYLVIQDANLYASTSLTNECIIFNQRRISYSYIFNKNLLKGIFLITYCFFLDVGFLLRRYYERYLVKIFL